MWADGAREKSLVWLRTFSGRLADDLGLTLSDTSDVIPDISNLSKMSQYTDLLARCYLKQGFWEYTIKKSWTPVGLLVLYHSSTLLIIAIGKRS